MKSSYCSVLANDTIPKTSSMVSGADIMLAPQAELPITGGTADAPLQPLTALDTCRFLDMKLQIRAYMVTSLGCAQAPRWSPQQSC